jgi:probable rRNA maturation factor
VVILQKKVAGLSQKSLERFVLRARRAAGLRGLTNVLVTTSSTVRSLNRQFRGKNQATDVLSFPLPLPVLSGGRKRSALAGEIAISADIAAQNAATLGHSPAAEVKVLALHGILHLAGFDHERDNGEMARKEMQLRRLLNLPVALIERTQFAQREASSKRHGTTYVSGTRRLR